MPFCSSSSGSAVPNMSTSMTHYLRTDGWAAISSRTSAPIPVTPQNGGDRVVCADLALWIRIKG
jgi:hypothetical protein